MRVSEGLMDWGCVEVRWGMRLGLRLRFHENLVAVFRKVFEVRI